MEERQEGSKRQSGGGEARRDKEAITHSKGPIHQLGSGVVPLQPAPAWLQSRGGIVQCSMFSAEQGMVGSGVLLGGTNAHPP